VASTDPGDLPLAVPPAGTAAFRDPGRAVRHIKKSFLLNGTWYHIHARDVPISETGTGSVASESIGGNPFHRRFQKHRRCSVSHAAAQRTSSYPQATRRVAATLDARSSRPAPSAACSRSGPPARVRIRSRSTGAYATAKLTRHQECAAPTGAAGSGRTDGPPDRHRRSRRRASPRPAPAPAAPRLPRPPP
jgi:hypothetical protein